VLLSHLLSLLFQQDCIEVLLQLGQGGAVVNVCLGRQILYKVVEEGRFVMVDGVSVSAIEVNVGFGGLQVPWGRRRWGHGSAFEKRFTTPLRILDDRIVVVPAQQI